jgi:hypothetical protein
LNSILLTLSGGKTDVAVSTRQKPIQTHKHLLRFWLLHLQPALTNYGIKNPFLGRPLLRCSAPVALQLL